MKNIKRLISLVLASVMFCAISVSGYTASNTAELRVTVVAGCFSMSENGDEYDFMGTDYSNFYCNVGTRYSVFAEPDGNYKFLYWKNSNGKILSTDEEYSFILGTDTNITAVYDRTYPTSRDVTFLTSSDQELSRQLYSSSVSADRIQVAPEIDRPGFIFLGWSTNGIDPIDYEDLQDAIVSAMQNGNVILTPIYIKDTSKKLQISVENGAGGGEYYFLSFATVTAGEGDFKYWTNSAGEIVSYNMSYTFAVTESDTLTANYGDSDAEIINRISTSITDTDSVTFVAYRDIPDEFTVIQSGIIITSRESIGTNENSFVMGSAGVEKGTTSWTDNIGTFMLTKTNASGTWYARPYIIYENAEGEIVTSYGAVVSDTIA